MGQALADTGNVKMTNADEWTFVGKTLTVH